VLRDEFDEVFEHLFLALGHGLLLG
jgi:hypothetical protein